MAIVGQNIKEDNTAKYEYYGENLLTITCKPVEHD